MILSIAPWVRPARSPRRWLLALVACWVSVVAAQTPDPPHLAEMPAPERVLAEIGGRDTRDTALRQVAALYGLRRMMEELSDGRVFRNTLTPDEQRIKQAYDSARLRIQTPYEAEGAPGQREWIDDRDRLYRDDRFRDELLERFFSDEWADGYAAKTIADQQRIRRSLGGNSSFEFQLQPEVRNNLLLQLAGALLFLAFAAWREARAFAPDPHDPRHVRAGLGNGFRVHSATGVATGVERSEYLVTSGGGPSPAGLPTEAIQTRETYTSLEIAGHRFSQISLPMNGVVDGARMSVAWIGSAARRYYLIANHDNGQRHTWTDTIERLLQPWLWPVVPLIWLFWTAFRFTEYTESVQAYGVMAVASVVLLVVYAFWCKSITARRLARVLETIAGPPLLDALAAESRANEQGERDAERAEREQVEVTEARFARRARKAAERSGGARSDTDA